MNEEQGKVRCGLDSLQRVSNVAVWPKLQPWHLETGIYDYKKERSIHTEKVMW